jgi:hypothetical protein
MLARIDGAVAQAREQAIRAQAYREELDALRVVGRSRDDAAEVTLGHTGAVLDLRLGRHLEEASLERIRAAVLEANAAGRAQLAGRVAELTGQAFGEESETTLEISALYGEMFPPVDDDRSGRGQGHGQPGVLR